ncbi:[F-actin]-monooxygenase mical3 [Thoreauomyces humboldtii]|nr:[F-actin]-monooxygenase mical3 [Thoreauomyces humboldtii]
MSLFPQASHLPSVSPTGGGIFSSVRKFVEADDVLEILDTFQAWKTQCQELEATFGAPTDDTPPPSLPASSSSSPRTPFETYSLLRKHTFGATHHLKDFWRAIAARFDDPHHHLEPVDHDPTTQRRALIVGGGPAGLRAAMELALQKFDSVVVLEKRDIFSRANVMRIHAEDMDELVKDFGARDFYRKICIQDRDVVAIRRLQIILLKMALCLGVQVNAGVELVSIDSDPTTPYWTATVNTLYPNDPIPPITYNTIVLATGEKSPLPTSLFFSRTSFRAGNATGITANFVPSSQPVPGLDAMQGGRASYLHMPFFNSLKSKGLELENFASYTTEESYYLVLTPKKSALLARGVLKSDDPDPVELVRRENVDGEELVRFARDVATEVGIPKECELLEMKASRDGKGWPDVGIFDFTAKTMSVEPSKMVVEDHEGGKKALLVALVGDALIQPFWPLGTGWARARGSCRLLGDVCREFGLDPARWPQRSDTVLRLHQEHYLTLKSESYAPMSQGITKSTSGSNIAA